jgi:hypothetical protein
LLLLLLGLAGKPQALDEIKEGLEAFPVKKL